MNLLLYPRLLIDQLPTREAESDRKNVAANCVIDPINHLIDASSSHLMMLLRSASSSPKANQ